MLHERRSTLKDLHLAGVCAGREERISTSIFMTTACFVEKSPTKQGRGSELVPPQGLGKKMQYNCQANVCSLVLSPYNKDLEQQTFKPSVHHSSRVLDKPCYSS